VAAWDAHDLAAAAACLHEDFENHQLPLGVTVGREAYLDHLRGWFDAYPNLRVELRGCAADGETVFIETVETGTRDGGETHTFFGCDVFEVRDGLVAIQRGYWDYSVATGESAPRAGGHRPEDSQFFQPRAAPQ
jgi:limonene-1,2-epoxide hydrolase